MGQVHHNRQERIKIIQRNNLINLQKGSQILKTYLFRNKNIHKSQQSKIKNKIKQQQILYHSRSTIVLFIIYMFSLSFIYFLQQYCNKIINHTCIRMKSDQSMPNSNKTMNNIIVYSDEAEIVGHIRRPILEQQICRQPFNLIGQLRAEFLSINGKAGGAINGSGCLIAPNIILTAAHTIYSRQFLGFKPIICTFTLGLHKKKGKPMNVIQYFIPREFIDAEDINSEESRNNDYALLRVQSDFSKQIALMKFMKFAAGSPMKDNEISIFGYPLDKNLLINPIKNADGQHQITMQFGEFGKIQRIQQSIIFYMISTSIGQSGSPIIQKNYKDQFEIVGIHKGAYSNNGQVLNYGISIHKMKKQIQSWAKEMDSSELKNYFKEFQQTIHSPQIQSQIKIKQQIYQTDPKNNIFEARQMQNLKCPSVDKWNHFQFQNKLQNNKSFEIRPINRSFIENTRPRFNIFPSNHYNTKTQVDGFLMIDEKIPHCFDLGTLNYFRIRQNNHSQFLEKIQNLQKSSQEYIEKMIQKQFGLDIKIENVKDFICFQNSIDGREYILQIFQLSRIDDTEQYFRLLSLQMKLMQSQKYRDFLKVLYLWKINYFKNIKLIKISQYSSVSLIQKIKQYGLNNRYMSQELICKLLQICIKPQRQLAYPLRVSPIDIFIMPDNNYKIKRFSLYFPELRKKHYQNYLYQIPQDYDNFSLAQAIFTIGMSLLHFTLLSSLELCYTSDDKILNNKKILNINRLNSCLSLLQGKLYYSKQLKQLIAKMVQPNPLKRCSLEYIENFISYYNFLREKKITATETMESKVIFKTKNQATNYDESVFQSNQLIEQLQILRSNQFLYLKQRELQFSKQKYIGSILNGKKHGKGVCFFKNGSCYDGQWKQDKMDGYGKLFNKDQILQYEGQWKNNYFSGRGTVYNNCVDMLDTKFNFLNFYQLRNYWIKYSGNFYKDLRHQEGVLYLTNGEYFEGSFQYDHVDGKGVFTDLSRYKIAGFWQNNFLKRIVKIVGGQ